MFASLSFPVLLLIFSVAAAIVWRAGITLAATTDALDKRFKLGEALGGIIILSIVTNLPEIAITISAALSNKIELAVGNILGGIALQTVVLVLLDAAGVGKQGTLSSQQSSLTPVLEGILVIAMLTVVVIGHQLPEQVLVARLTPASLLLLIVWMTGIWLVSRAHRGLPWQLTPPVPPSTQTESATDKRSTQKTALLFALAAGATLLGGVVLEETGDAMSKTLGMNSVLFGATVLAAATALPEISTGLAAIKSKEYTLAVSDIFGGNAFLPTLLALATVISGKAVLPIAQKSDIYLTGLGILLTVVYLYGFLFRPKRQVARMGIDSLLVLVVYLLGVVGLFLIAKT